MSQPTARDRFLGLVQTTVTDGSLVKLTLGRYRGSDPALRNVFIRPVALKSGPHLAFLWRYTTRDVTKNHVPEEATREIGALIGSDFLDAHLFSASQNAQLECQPDGTARLRITTPTTTSTIPLASAEHNRTKTHLIPAQAPWLRGLGVTNERGQPREGMADKFRQIQKFAELLSHLLAEAKLPEDRPLTIVDMGSGKGYLTFAVAALLGERAQVRGIEARPELVDLCNRVARENGLASRLSFSAGHIADAKLEACDVLIALHACDTATDDALARGLAAGAQLLVVAPCCQKELRRQLTPPPILVDALRHGIFQERQSEFVTDSLRAQLLEWMGFQTKVFEFISTEHTAKNVMISAIKAAAQVDEREAKADRIRDFARFYGIRSQRLASVLNFPL